MSPLDAALLRLGRAVLPSLSPRLAERVQRAEQSPEALQDGEAARVADDVSRLAGMLAG